jgi:hypothetical protein
MAVPRDLAEALWQVYGDCDDVTNYPDALRKAGWCVVNQKLSSDN